MPATFRPDLAFIAKVLENFQQERKFANFLQKFFANFHRERERAQLWLRLGCFYRWDWLAAAIRVLSINWMRPMVSQSRGRQPQLLVALFLSSHKSAPNHATFVDNQCQRHGASYRSMTDIPDSTHMVYQNCNNMSCLTKDISEI